MKLNKLTIPLAGLLLFSTSCGSDFLNQVPDNEYVEDNFYASDEAVASSTAPLYNRAWFDYNQRSIVPMGSLRANDVYSPYNNPQFTSSLSTPLTSL